MRVRISQLEPNCLKNNIIVDHMDFADDKREDGFSRCINRKGGASHFVLSKYVCMYLSGNQLYIPHIGSTTTKVLTASLIFITDNPSGMRSYSDKGQAQCFTDSKSGSGLANVWS